MNFFTKQLQIGFLTPYSGIYPYYAQHLMAGFSLGVGQKMMQEGGLVFKQEYSQMGGAKATAEAAKKLLFFDRVAVLSGLVSYKSLPEIMPQIDNAGKLAFFFDLGEYIPSLHQRSQHMFFSSYQLWQGQYALGYWAEQEFGSKGLILSSLYEAGYHLHSSFRSGAVAAGAKEIDMHIPAPGQDVHQIDFTHFFEEVRKSKPAYVHVILSGKIGLQFLLEWKKSGLNGLIPLLLSENMAFDDMLDDLSKLGLNFYTASLWNKASESAPNQLFVHSFQQFTGQPPNVFALIGYEAGLAFRELIPIMLKGDYDAVTKILQQEVIQGPRGDRNFYPPAGFALPLIDILKINTSSAQPLKTIVAQGKGLTTYAAAFDEIHRESQSGWQNPFLCV